MNNQGQVNEGQNVLASSAFDDVLNDNEISVHSSQENIVDVAQQPVNDGGQQPGVVGGQQPGNALPPAVVNGQQPPQGQQNNP